LGYQLYEITSSGLTHTSKDHFPKGELFDKLFFPETYNVLILKKKLLISYREEKIDLSIIILGV